MNKLFLIIILNNNYIVIMDKKINNKLHRFWIIDDLEIYKSFIPETYYKKITSINDNYHTLFMAVESVSRYLYIINTNPKDKNEKIINWIHTYKPKYIWCDAGIINNTIRDELRKIDCIPTIFKAYQNDNGMFNNSGKSESVYLLSYKHPLSKIDRVSRTIRQIIAYLTRQEIMNDDWVKNVKRIQDIYNNHKHSSLYDWIYSKEQKKMIKQYYTPEEVFNNEKLYNTMKFNQQLKKLEYNKKVNNLKIGDFVRYKIPLPTGYKKTNALSMDIYKIINKYNNLFIIQNIKDEKDVKDNVAYGELKKISLFTPESSSFEEATEKIK